MELYTFLRQLADSWGLLALSLFFAGMILWVLRPGSRRGQQEAAQSIFRNEDRPARDDRGSQMKEASK